MVAKTLSDSKTLESREGSQPLAVTQSHVQKTSPAPTPSKCLLPPQPPPQSADPGRALDSDQTLFKKCFCPPWSCHYRELSVRTCIPPVSGDRHSQKKGLASPLFQALPFSRPSQAED